MKLQSVQTQVTYPQGPMAILCMMPIPCGYRSDPRRACSCTPPQVEKYLSKISGPLLDRIDLHVEVPAVPFTQLAEMPPDRPRPSSLRTVRHRATGRSTSTRSSTSSRIWPTDVDSVAFRPAGAPV